MVITFVCIQNAQKISLKVCGQDEVTLERIIESFNSNFKDYLDLYNKCILYPVHITMLKSIINNFIKSTNSKGAFYDLYTFLDESKSYQFIGA